MELVARLGFIVLQWCYNPATILHPDSDCFLSDLLSAIGVQSFGYSRMVERAYLTPSKVGTNTPLPVTFYPYARHHEQMEALFDMNGGFN